MPIQPTDMIAIGLPAAYWDVLLSAAQNAPLPHNQIDPVIRALAGQMQQHVARAEAADKAAAESGAPAPDTPAAASVDPASAPKPSRRTRKAA